VLKGFFCSVRLILKWDAESSVTLSMSPWLPESLHGFKAKTRHKRWQMNLCSLLAVSIYFLLLVPVLLNIGGRLSDMNNSNCW
jgi:hypothetical protein